MLVYKCFCFSEVMDQLYLTVRGAVQGPFRATLGVASVFVHAVLRPGWGAWRCPPPPHTHLDFLSSMLILIILFIYLFILFILCLERVTQLA